MKKTISRILLLAMILYLCLPIANFVYAKENIRVVINDVCIDENAYIETIGERLYVSARSVAEPMGLNLDWNDVKKTLAITYGDKNISLVVASNLAIVDNTPLETSQPLKIMSDRAIIDLTFLCKVLDAPLTFNEAENKYSITISVPDNFQPDIIKPAKASDTLVLYDAPEDKLTKAKEVATALDLETIWDDEAKALTLSSAFGDNLTMFVGDKIAWFNGESIDCPAPLNVINDEAYVDFGFVEKLFTTQIPDTYMPIRQIADELNLKVEWIDEIKTVELTDSNSNKLSIVAGSSFLKLNDKFHNNSAPLVVKDGVALTNKTIIEDVFAKANDKNDDEVQLQASTKNFSGTIILDKSFNYTTYIDIIVLSVQSITYSNASGTYYTDYNTSRITIPAYSTAVSYSVTKNNCYTNYKYALGYSFVYENSFYYKEGYLAYNGSTIAYFPSYSSTLAQYGYYDTTTNIDIRPQVFSGVTLDNVVFSGKIKTDDGSSFGSGSTMFISVRQSTYYGITDVASTTISTSNVASKNFSISVPNNTTTRNTSLYLYYSLNNGNSSITPTGYYQSSTSSVSTMSQATSWNIARDTLSNISFVAHTKKNKTISGRFYMPDDTPVANNREVTLGIDIWSVRSSTYSYNYYLYDTYENVASIKAGKTYVDYEIPMILEDDLTYIFSYKVENLYPDVFPFGHSTLYSNTINPDYAAKYTTYSDMSSVNFYMKESINSYTYVNNLPYTVNSSIKSSDYIIPNGPYCKGYYIYLVEGQTLTAQLTSTDFDSYLLLLDESMLLIDDDDDGAGNGNSLINYYIRESGYYFIYATTYSTNTVGSFTLDVYTDKPLYGSTLLSTKKTSGRITAVEADYTIVNNKSTSQKVMMIMALYDKNDVLLNVLTKTVTVNSISDNQSFEMDLRSYSNIGKVKSYIVTPDMKPVSNADFISL